MNWATHYIEKLAAGANEIQFRPRGSSMTGKIESGQLVTVVPVRMENLKLGDIVLCKVKGSVYLHLVKALRPGQALIGNNRGGINGWTKTIYGRCIRIEP